MNHLSESEPHFVWTTTGDFLVQLLCVHCEHNINQKLIVYWFYIEFDKCYNIILLP